MTMRHPLKQRPPDLSRPTILRNILPFLFSLSRLGLSACDDSSDDGSAVSSVWLNELESHHTLIQDDNASTS